MGAGIEISTGDLRETEALLVLKTQTGLGDRGIGKLLNAHGSASRALRARGIQTDLLESRAGDFPISTWVEEGIGMVPLTSQTYPHSLRELSDPPPVIFWRGRRELLNTPSVAIVGARRATGVGLRAAETMGRILARAGVTVVSGLALGIDGAAHRGALDGGGATVAVLGSGVNVAYPRAHHSLFRAIGECGTLVSEFLPTDSAAPHHFPKRNRIIAALASAIVVVEAAQRSGAFITVDHGLDLGRDILAIPGSVENPRASGTNALIRDGARILTDPKGILQELAELGFEGASSETQYLHQEEAAPDLPAELKAFWAILSSDPTDVDQVARKAGVSSGEALAGLSALELGGWARQCPGMRFRRG